MNRGAGIISTWHEPAGYDAVERVFCRSSALMQRRSAGVTLNKCKTVILFRVERYFRDVLPWIGGYFHKKTLAVNTSRLAFFCCTFVAEGIAVLKKQVNN